MNQIGRRIYYDPATGEVLVDTGERAGFVVETPVEEDFALYDRLQGKTQQDVGCLRFPFGHMAEQFGTCTNYKVDPVSEEMVFDFTPIAIPEAPTGPTLEELQQRKAELERQIADLESK